MNLEEMTPLAAAFTRGFMEKAKEGNQGLRACGEAGRAQVEEWEMEISSQYITKLTRGLAEDGYIIKSRKGRHYVVAQGERWNVFFDWLEKEARSDWGRSNKSEQEWPDRLKVMNAQRLGLGLLITKDHRLPSTAFRMAKSLSNDGEFDTLFVPKGKKAVLYDKKDGKWVKDSIPKVWSKMDHEEIQARVDELDD